MVLGWTSPTDGSCAQHREFMVGWVHRVVGNLECWFAAGDRDYVAIPDFTLADILMAHVVRSGMKDEALIAPYPAVTAYRAGCMARAAWRRTIRGVWGASGSGIVSPIDHGTVQLPLAGQALQWMGSPRFEGDA